MFDHIGVGVSDLRDSASLSGQLLRRLRHCEIYLATKSLRIGPR